MPCVVLVSCLRRVCCHAGRPGAVAERTRIRRGGVLSSHPGPERLCFTPVLLVKEILFLREAAGGKKFFWFFLCGRPRWGRGEHLTCSAKGWGK